MPPPASALKSRKRKAAAEPDTALKEPEPSSQAPSTPQKRRARKDNIPPPATPTPSAIGFIAEGIKPTDGISSTPPAKTKLPKPAAVRRLADPNKTNAPLLSPQTSRVVASKTVEAASPSKAPRTTTGNILEEACAHLIKVDERMRPLIEKHPCRIFSPEGLAEQIDPFEALCSSIISQQVSGAAARAIKARFIALFDLNGGGGGGDAGDPSKGGKPVSNNRHPNEEGGTSAVANPDSEEDMAKGGRRRFPQPSEVAAMPLEKLRTAGLSQRKAEYLSGLAEKFVSGELSAQLLADAPYEELFERLIAVRGLGKWSVEMFACFALKRMDVFSTGDLGVQRGMAAFVGRDVAKLKSKGNGKDKWKYMSEREMEEISRKFSPYKSLFMWYMWRVEETDVSTME